MYTRLQLFIGAAAIAAGLAFTESSNTIAGAQTTKNAAKKALHKAEHASILSELHQAKHLLDIALHDYHGHRAKADHEIHKAIHLLEHGHHHKGEHKSSFKAVAHHGPIGDEMQKDSDTKLRQAEKLVHAAHLQLVGLHSKGKHDHHKEAAHLLSQAAHEIEKALHVVQHYHDHHKKAVAAAVVK